MAPLNSVKNASLIEKESRRQHIHKQNNKTEQKQQQQHQHQLQITEKQNRLLSYVSFWSNNDKSREQNVPVIFRFYARVGHVTIVAKMAYSPTDSNQQKPLQLLILSVKRKPNFQPDVCSFVTVYAYDVKRDEMKWDAMRCDERWCERSKKIWVKWVNEWIYIYMVVCVCVCAWKNNTKNYFICLVFILFHTFHMKWAYVWVEYLLGQCKWCLTHHP